jgi:hypothetical protein
VMGIDKTRGFRLPSSKALCRSTSFGFRRNIKH